MEKVGELSATRSDVIDVEWQISKFSSSTEMDTFVESPDFSHFGSSWCLRIYTNGQRCHKSDGYLGMYLRKRDSGSKVALAFTLGLKAAGGKKDPEYDYTYEFKRDMAYGTPKLLSRAELRERKLELMPGDVLTVTCSLRSTYPGVAKGSKESGTEVVGSKASSREEQSPLSQSICMLVRDFKELLLSGRNGDVTFKVKGKEFKAHRAILAARSPVFAAMMEHQMKEKTTGVVDIEDSDPDTFPDFLQYLYTGSAANMTSESALTLYETADKYQVDELKRNCLEYLLRSISVENFCEVMTLSLQHEEKGLVDAATQFFIENSIEIALTSKWQVFLGENPVASNELLLKLMREKLQ